MNERLTIAEAAQRYAVSQSAIRRLLDAGKLVSKRDAQNRHTLSVDELAEAFSRRVPDSRSGAIAGKPSADRSDELPATNSRLIQNLEDALSRERRLNDELRAHNYNLQGELIKLTAEMKALLGKEGDGVLSRWFRR